MQACSYHEVFASGQRFSDSCNQTYHPGFRSHSTHQEALFSQKVLEFEYFPGKASSIDQLLRSPHADFVR